MIDWVLVVCAVSEDWMDRFHLVFGFGASYGMSYFVPSPVLLSLSTIPPPHTPQNVITAFPRDLLHGSLGNPRYNTSHTPYSILPLLFHNLFHGCCAVLIVVHHIPKHCPLCFQISVVPFLSRLWFPHLPNHTSLMYQSVSLTDVWLSCNNPSSPHTPSPSSTLFLGELLI